MGGASILIIDDDENILFTLRMRLESLGYRVLTALDGLKGLEELEKESLDVILLDLKLPGMDGLDVLREIKKTFPGTEVIIFTAQGTIETAVTAIKEGAYDYITKPIDNQRLGILIEKALERGEIFKEAKILRSQLRHFGKFDKMIGNSLPMQEVYRLIEQVAPSDATVLINGESGTGKEFVARTVHRLSPRRKKPFIAVNCSAITETLWESEVFGYERGAFTGARIRKDGYFELAEGGTLFLDEVVDMSPDVQAKFLRVLEEKKIRRLGGKKEMEVDVRIIAATNRSLEEAVSKGALREDLYYRLNVFTIYLPPLRERKEDITLLIQAFVDDFASKYEKKVRSVDNEVMDFFEGYQWPGNVRELRNAIERAMIVCDEELIQVKHLPPPFQTKRPLPYVNNAITVPVGSTIEELEKELIIKTLEATAGNKTRAAEILGISLKTLHNRLNKYEQQM